MMTKVQIKGRDIYVGSKKVPLVSGEMHYWRLNPNYWKQILERVREMGLQVVSTYIPWDYHEYERGKFDFTGETDPARDLKRFLELTRREGFWLVIRPGPYIYSEWPNEGAPAYAYKYHRLHPKFQGYAKNYMRRVMEVIKPYFATRTNGHIILFQADNEIDPWPDIFGHQYGLDGKPGIFQDYLKKLYHHNIGKLNECWGTNYRAFKESGAFIATMLNDDPGLPLKGDKELQRNIDYFKFKYDYSRQYASWVVQEYRRLGVDVPIYLNLYPFFYAHDWVEMQKVSDLVGVDLYPSAELGEDRFEQRKFIDKIRYLSNVSRVPFIAEFAAGVWHARHYETGVLTPNHYRLLGISALMAGVVGWNWYMLVNRDNWYMSPINEWGRTRGELFEVFKEMVTIFRRMQPASLTKMTNIAATFPCLQYAARTLTHNSPVLVSLYESDIDYEMIDPRNGAPEQKLLFYSGNQWMDKASQENLRQYVNRGGILVAFRDYPRKDDRFEPCSLVGFEDPERILFEFKRKLDLQLDKGRPIIEVISSVYTFGNVEGKIMADLGPYGRQPIGYEKKIGKGRIMHLGVAPTRELVAEITDYFKIPRASHSPTPDVHTALFRRGQSFYLVITNNGSEDKSASIDLPGVPGRAKVKARDILHPEREYALTGRQHTLTLGIRRKDGLVIELKT